jgi:uncharacterized protein (DUF58 family)
VRSLLARLRALLRPPRTLKITRVGRTYLILTVGVGLGALNTGNNLLYLVLGLLLSLIIASGVLSEACLRGVRIKRLGTEAAFATEPCPFRWVLERTEGSAFALTVAETGPGLEGQAFVRVLEPARPVTARADLVAPRRGVYELEAVRVTTTYPLGLFAKSRVLELPGTLVVYPKRRAPRAAPAAAAHGGTGGGSTPSRGQGGGDVYGLTELREGDDARRIHWLKSAAIGTLVRTEHERDERRAITLEVDPGLPPEQLDAVCEETAAAASGLLGQGVEVGLVVGTRRVRPASGPAQSRRILEALAWAGFEERT